MALGMDVETHEICDLANLGENQFIFQLDTEALR
jgi:hypothetical protein